MKDRICKRCGDPIASERGSENQGLTIKFCACGVMLEYDPEASETGLACPICRAPGSVDLEPPERIDAQIPHVHLVPLVEDAGASTLGSVLSHSTYEDILQEYQARLDDLEEALEGREGRWSEIQQVALALRNTADRLEVLHASPSIGVNLRP